MDYKHTLTKQKSNKQRLEGFSSTSVRSTDIFVLFHTFFQIHVLLVQIVVSRKILKIPA